MIDKFAVSRCGGQSEFIDLNHIRKSMLLAPLIVPKFAPAFNGELRRNSEWGHSL